MLRTRAARFWPGMGEYLLPWQRAMGTLQIIGTTQQPHTGNGHQPDHSDDGNDADLASLREKLECLQAIIAANIDAIVIVDAAGRIIEFNAAAERTFGYRRDQAIGALFVELLVPPAQRTGIMRPDQCAPFDLAEEHARGRRLEVEALCADGSTIPCELTIIPLPAPGPGKMPAFAGFMRDLTPEKTAAAVLHRERELLHTLFETLPDFIYFKDTAGRFLRVNRAQAANLGRTDPNDVVGKTDFDFYPAEMAEHFAGEERQLLATGEPLINHLERQSAEGAPERWALTTKVPVRGPDGTIIGLVGVTRDITELKQAQDALLSSEHRFRALVQNSPDVITLIGADGTVLYVSSAFERLAGEDPAPVLGKPGFDLLHPDDLPTAHQALAQALSEPGEPVRVELRTKQPDGSWRIHHCTLMNFLHDPAIRAIVVNSHDITEHRAMEEALRASETHLRLALSAAKMGTWDWDLRTGTVISLPPALNGATPTPITYPYTDFLAMVHPDDRARVDAEFQQVLASGDYFSSEFRLVRPDASVLWVLSLGRVERDDAGNPVRMRGVEMDITARKGDEAALQTSERRFRALVQNSSDLITIYDRNGTLRYASPSMTSILGQNPEDWIGRSALSLAHPDDVRLVRRAFITLLRAPGSKITIEFRAQHADGSWRWLEAIGTNLLDDPSIAGIVANARDITAHKHYAGMLAHQAYHDALTGLPNRALFTERLHHALQRLQDEEARLAILFIDLDRFKVVNDSLGHDGGDLLLIETARRLATCLRPGDTLARFGGDEFAILVEGVAAGAAGSVAERLLSALQEPFTVQGHDVFISGSIGVVLADTSDRDATRLLRAADVAMYKAKDAGRNRWALYDERTGDRAAKRLALESQLRYAIEQRQIEAHYQPVIDLATGRIHGFEALARWRHPERGLLSPATFIAIAEETGLIGPLGDWVLEVACRQAAAWSQMLPTDPPIIAVNVSPRQLRCPRFPHTLWRVLGESGLPPHRLELEVTEEALAGDDSVPDELLRTLSELGIRLAMDDFGTGYSSLSRIHRLPLQTLKVDRSFVSGLGNDPHATAIVRAVAALARELGISVTAEGIETCEQRRLATELGCVFGQGYLFAGPLTAEQATTILLNADMLHLPGQSAGNQ